MMTNQKPFMSEKAFIVIGAGILVGMAVFLISAKIISSSG